MNRMLLLLFLIHWCLGNFFAQTTSAPLLVPSATEKAPDIVFSHLTEKDGLSYSFVTDMVQDRDGIELLVDHHVHKFWHIWRIDIP